MIRFYTRQNSETTGYFIEKAIDSNQTGNVLAKTMLGVSRHTRIYINPLSPSIKFQFVFLNISYRSSGEKMLKLGT